MEIRQTTNKDIEGISRLFKEQEFLEGEPSSLSVPVFLEWLFFKNPDPNRYQLVAVKKDEVIAHYGSIPLSFRFKEKKVTGGLGSGLIVDQPFRKSPVFLQLQSTYLREFSKYKIDFVFGLVTREQVLNVHLRTGYRRVGVCHVLARPYRFSKLFERLFPKYPILQKMMVAPILRCFFPVLNGLRPRDILIEQRTKFEERWDPKIDRILSQLSFTADRNAKILNWRFCDFLPRGYEVLVATQRNEFVGYLVLRQMKMQGFDVLVIVDILFEPQSTEIGRAFLWEIHHRALTQKVDLISVLLPPHSLYWKFFRRAGFLKTPESFTLVVGEPKNGTFKLDEEMARNWHLTWFDHDVV